MDWAPVPAPEPRELRGDSVVLRPLDPAGDAEALWAESHPPRGEAGTWTYMAYGPFADPAEYRRALEAFAASRDPLYYAVVPTAMGRPAGVASFLRMVPEHGVIEIGHIWFGASLRRTTAATEAIYLLASHAFDDLGYRRLEWKCDALNAASRAAAVRFGFRFEGIFAAHMVVKARNRDTAWYAITDREWPAIAAAFRQWLAAENQRQDGRQVRPLSAFMPGR